MGNSPHDDYSHVDSLCGERRQVYDKAYHVFLDDFWEYSRRKIRLNEWEDAPRGRTLKILEGKDKVLKRKVAFQLKCNNKLFDKRKKEKEDTKISQSASTTTSNKSNNKIKRDCKDN